jgi:ribonuclease HI
VKKASKNTSQVSKWKPPEGEFLKVNTDGCFDAKTRSGGWGIIARNASGEMQGAGAGKLAHVADAFQAEAEACSHALQALQGWGMSRIQLETDSQLLVNALKNNAEDLGPCSLLIKEIKESLFLNFICLKIEYCPRACNRVADSLADYG